MGSYEPLIVQTTQTKHDNPQINADFLFKILMFVLFCSPGIAGMCSKTAVAPLDRLKILLQAHQPRYKALGVPGGLSAIVRDESVMALYKGNGAQMVRIFPYAATQFTSFEIYKRVCSCQTYYYKLMHQDYRQAFKEPDIAVFFLDIPLSTKHTYYF